MASNAQSEEVKQRDANANGNAGVQHRWSIDHLIPATRQVEEWGNFRDSGNSQDGNEKENRQCAKETFPSDGHERRDRISSWETDRLN